MNEWERVEKEKKLREQWEGVSNFIKMLFNELEEKDEQIEKMKCSGNCKHLYINLCALNFRTCSNCKDKWELKEIEK